MNMNNEKLRYFILFRFACLFICLFTLPFIIMHMKTDQKLWKSYWMSTKHAYSFHLFFNLFLPSLFLFAWSLFLFRFDMNHLFQTKCLNWCFSLVDQFLLKWFCWNDFVLLWFCFLSTWFRLNSEFILIFKIIQLIFKTPSSIISSANIQNHNNYSWMFLFWLNNFIISLIWLIWKSNRFKRSI